MANVSDKNSNQRTGPTEGFVKAVAALIVAYYMHRRWF